DPGSDAETRKTGPLAPEFLEDLPQEDPLIGKTLDRYEIIRRVGEGAMGAVYEVRHRGLNKHLAMKIIHAELARVPEFMARFAQEARACSVLDHPNCIQVTDFGRASSGQLYLVMEFVEGESLTSRLENHLLTLDETLDITRQILSGLAHAHAAGIVHRDIKPDNIMLASGKDGQAVVKILDFGIAKMPVQSGGKLTKAGVIFGTPEFMAPEQVMTTQVDGRADLYAVGAILWLMLMRKEPFSADGEVELLNLKLTQAAPVLQDVAPDQFPETLSRFLVRALEREPSARFVSAQEMAETLELLDLIPGRRHAREQSPAWRSTKRFMGRFFGSLRRSWRWIRSQLQAWYDCDDDLTHLPSWALRMKLLRSTRRGRGILSGFFALLLAIAAVTTLSITSGEEEVAGWGGRITASMEKRLLRVRMFLSKGACREAALDLKNLLQEQPKLPVGHYLLGGAEVCRGRNKAGLEAYTRAIALQPTYHKDARIFEDVETLLEKGTPEERKATLLFANQHLDLAGLRLVIKAASNQSTLSVRHAAVKLVKERGIGPNIDWVTSLSWDLEQLPRCGARRAVVSRLRKLGDPRAIPALIKALREDGGKKNACASAQIKRALKELRAKKLRMKRDAKAAGRN
ncbi:MAG: protein kinase, partial [Deltaproteobacteria bacterium]|nr:protein kinase [Deltaproteobacteria bacterium]